MIVDEKSGRPKKRWMDCVNKNMHMKTVSAVTTADRSLWTVKKNDDPTDREMRTGKLL